MRGFLRARALAAVTLVAFFTIAALGGSAQAASGACASEGGSSAALGSFQWRDRCGASDLGCVGADNAAVGDPPLIFHGGPVMGTQSTGPLVVTPIFWNPAGHPMDPGYKSSSTYLGDVAPRSGQHTNVFSTLTEYFGNNGQIRYKVRAGTPIDDTSALPARRLHLARTDTHRDLRRRLRLQRLPGRCPGSGRDQQRHRGQQPAGQLSHIYVLFLPKHVESCFIRRLDTHRRPTPARSTTSRARPTARTTARPPTGDACTRTCRSRSTMSPVGFTCGSDASSFGVIESPNGNPDADTEISPTSHEIMEAITDPDTVDRLVRLQRLRERRRVRLRLRRDAGHGRAALQPGDQRSPLPDPGGVQQQRLRHHRPWVPPKRITRPALCKSRRDGPARTRALLIVGTR